MSFLETQIQMAREERDLLIKQYVAVSEQIRGTIDDALKVPLEFKRQQLARQTSEKEVELAALEAKRPSPSAPGKPAGQPKNSGNAPVAVNRRAVLIGIDNYDHYPLLDVCASDAEAIGDALGKGGRS